MTALRSSARRSHNTGPMPSSTPTNPSQTATPSMLLRRASMQSFAIVTGWPVARSQLVMVLRQVSLGMIKLLRSLLTLRFR